VAGNYRDAFKKLGCANVKILNITEREDADSQKVAEQIEKRVPYRRILKQSLMKILSNRAVKGSKVLLAGRLDGKEIARTEHLEEGSLPLQTLRADVDFARATAHTTYGTVGVKVWIYKGDIMTHDPMAIDKQAQDQQPKR